MLRKFTEYCSSTEKCCSNTISATCCDINMVCIEDLKTLLVTLTWFVLKNWKHYLYFGGGCREIIKIIKIRNSLVSRFQLLP